MATTNLIGTSKNYNGISIGGVGKLKHGRIDKTKGDIIQTNVMGVDVKHGKTEGSRQRGSTVFAAGADRSGGSPLAGFTYNVPAKPKNKTFGSLV